MKTITDPKILAALDIPAGCKLVQVGRDWAEWVSMPVRYDAAEVTHADAMDDSMIRVHRGADFTADLEDAVLTAYAYATAADNSVDTDTAKRMMSDDLDIVSQETEIAKETIRDWLSA